MEFFNYVTGNYTQIFDLLWQHIYLTVFSVFVASAVGVPLGILISRVDPLAKPVIGFANVMQAIPSLALLGFLIPFLGIGSTPAIVMVVLYSLLPIVKNTYTGLTNIDKNILEAAKGIGLTSGQMMRKVQLPLAFPIIMAGIRISAVTAVGLMTIAAFIGAGGLGYLVFSGVSSVDNNMILAGAIPACILALGIDFVVGRIERKLSYKTKKLVKLDAATLKKREQRRKILIPVVSVVLVLTVGAAVVFGFISKEETIRVGSKNFTEQLIVGNMVAELIEDKTDLKVQRDLNLGGTQVVFNAITNDEIDVYVEYTGTALINLLKNDLINDPDEVYEVIKQQLADKYQLETLDPIGFNNTYTLAMEPEVAEQYGIDTFSDLAAVSHQLSIGTTIEFTNREDGMDGMVKTYGMNFKGSEAVDGGLRYTALKNGDVQVIDAFATDGLLEEFQLKVLVDDKQFFPPYHAVPIVRKEVLEKYPELEDVLNSLAGKIDDATMRQLNYRVDSLNETPEKVARDFLIQEGLISGS